MLEGCARLYSLSSLLVADQQSRWLVAARCLIVSMPQIISFRALSCFWDDAGILVVNEGDEEGGQGEEDKVGVPGACEDGETESTRRLSAQRGRQL